MPFTHDTETTLRAMEVLVNTAPRTPVGDGADGADGPSGRPAPPTDDDGLATLADLADFVREWEFTGRIDGDEAELAAVRRLRDRLRGLFGIDEEALVAAVNDLLRQGRALPQLVRHDHWGWHLHATDDQQAFATRFAVEVAMGLADVVRTQETDRLKRCAAPECSGVLVDLSRNRSRRFCSTTCGNRLAAAAYRARRGD